MLESYYIVSCSDYPSSGSAVFSEITVRALCRGAAPRLLQRSLLQVFANHSNVDKPNWGAFNHNAACDVGLPCADVCLSAR